MVAGGQQSSLKHSASLPIIRAANPALRQSGARLLFPEGQRQGYRAGLLLALPDAVLAHGDGLLCLSYKGGDGRLVEPSQWRAQFRVDVMLQCIANAMAVAGQRQQPTAALWRGRL